MGIRDERGRRPPRCPAGCSGAAAFERGRIVQAMPGMRSGFGSRCQGAPDSRESSKGRHRAAQAPAQACNISPARALEALREASRTTEASGNDAWRLPDAPEPAHRRCRPLGAGIEMQEKKINSDQGSGQSFRFRMFWVCLRPPRPSESNFRVRHLQWSTLTHP